MKPVEYALDDDIAAIATALAPSALGIIRTSGSKSIERLVPYFSRPKALLNAGGHTLVYGWLHDNGIKIDEVILCVYRCPKSNTGENAVEIICHGGTHLVKAVYGLCLKAGFRAAERGEFTFRSFIHGKTDLTRAEAVREIIDSKTAAAREKAAGRLGGAVYQEIERIKSAVLSALAALEVGIEYPEDEQTIADSFNIALLEQPLAALSRLAASWQSEKIYQNGVKVVLAGKTNAGKSSLFNALLKEDRAIVSNIHGTTRDWIEAALDFNGIPVILYDTAGIRATDDTVEVLGVQRTVELVSSADIVLYLIDGTVPVSSEDAGFIKTAQVPLIIIRTKADESAFTPQLDSCNFELPIICASAKTGEGIDRLITEVVKLVTVGIQLADSTVSLGTERQKSAVCEAAAILQHAADAVTVGFPLDAVVQDLEDAIHILGTITGEVRSDDILDRIFSDFCVGK
ncbi:MAG: tRNA uridine-5-carboxymethylaminomethyl(34) synthesis GTPase MnmE [Treponema sp.]